MSPAKFPTAKFKPRKLRDEIDPGLLAVEHDTPMPSMVNRFASKYDRLLNELRPGSCIRCESSEVANLAQAMRKAIAAGRMPAISNCKVLSRTRCEDGHGRVWAMPAER